MISKTGESCKHMLAIFDLMTVGKLTFHNGDRAESEATIECETCMTWDVTINQWVTLEAEIPANLQ